MFRILILLVTAITMLFFYSSPFIVGFWTTLTLTYIMIIGSIIIAREGAFRLNVLDKSIAGIFILSILVSLFNSPMFRASDFANALTVKDVNATDVIVQSPNQIRTVTEKMALTKADKILGRQIAGIELNTQFELGAGSLVKYHNEEFWVFPLEYSGFFKWVSNDAIPGYVKVSAFNPSAKAEFVQESFKATPSGYFMDNLKRDVFFETGMHKFEKHFEIDEKGNPVWIVSILKYKILGNLFEPESVYIVNATDGSKKHYALKDVPNWVDRIIQEDMATEYIENYGMYQKGWLNTIFSQINVLVPTHYEDNEIWLVQNKKDNNLKWFTGMSSSNSKDSSLSTAILMDTKSLTAYRISDVQGVTDAKGATQSAQAKLGANSVRWKPVLPMPIIIDNKWYWTTSIIDDKTNIYQKTAIVNGKDITKVRLVDSLVTMVEHDNDVKNNTVSPKDRALMIVKNLRERLDALESEIKMMK